MAKKIVKDKSQEISPEQEINNPAEQEAKIAELAYFKAERRGFSPDNELQDWLEAEQEYFFIQNQNAQEIRSNLGFQVEG
jgi:hypothetical protein